MTGGKRGPRGPYNTKRCHELAVARRELNRTRRQAAEIACVSLGTWEAAERGDKVSDECYRRIYASVASVLQ